ncbi:hypothetical protein GCM10011515_03410 [Tsuneonella deserti]|uniref:Alpha/beta hydrolase n=1 Tax=Tsuneonella deserti TaxID=2035528 RepID=A0ABQ1RYR3_9SPHN|nr:alpha/beta hydrolase [Tsuneonella deserti]GGD87220.1 hypothetical protein GCM10011515_03410 [Tsuneonella deserti]
MRRAAALSASIFAVLAVPASAQGRTVTTIVEEWVEVDAGAERLLPAGPSGVMAGPAYGPFRVIDERRAALVDATDAFSPAQFKAMLREHPGIAAIEMIECPGTDDDTANLQLGRMIRAAGIATHVPARGSVRSGAVELFLAGSSRVIDDGAEFAVHAWQDSDGLEPGDFAADSAVNRAYVDYYREMGLARPQAFYDMTNAVPNDTALWLTAQDMRAWLGEGRDGDVTVAAPTAALTAAPTIAYLDLGARLP